MDIYDRINELLEKNQKTRKEMCDELGISYHTLNSLYKRRTERIKFQMVQEIANYLGTTSDYLAFGNDTVVSYKDKFIDIIGKLNDEDRADLFKYAEYLYSKSESEKK
ncbi:helix-turn-helix domain-containing protein [Paracholeplasma manati]|uniref:helix-turn-helix domain-containing protein n=1 Tax=Paracholeplasma manati TaxID=591373 RepID=UPI002407AFA6|nr:helix-turn-helix domain-containing protein [Paracholeplasma manati]MDG0887898.1 helix-turn-helix domain-containing protein [Paracholeplasma manati]